MFRLSHVVLPPGCREAEGEVAGEVTGEGGRVLHRREAPAQAVVAGAGGQAEPDVRAAGKAPAKGREAPGRLRGPTARRVAAPRPLRQRVRGEQRVQAARRLPAPVLAQADRWAPLRRRGGVKDQRRRETLVLEVVRGMGQQGAALEVEGQPERRDAPREAAAEFHPEAGLGIPPVMARPKRQLRGELAPVVERDAVAPLQSEPQPGDVRVPRGQFRRLVRGGPRPQRVRGQRQRRAGGRGRLRQQGAPQARRGHGPVDVGRERLPGVGLELDFPCAVAGRAPELEPLRRRPGGIGHGRSQRRLDRAGAFAYGLTANRPGRAGTGLGPGPGGDVRVPIAAPALGPQQRHAHQPRVPGVVRAQQARGGLAVERESALPPVEIRLRRPAPKGETAAGAVRSGRGREAAAEQGLPRGQGDGLRPGARAPGARVPVGRDPGRAKAVVLGAVGGPTEHARDPGQGQRPLPGHGRRAGVLSGGGVAVRVIA